MVQRVARLFVIKTRLEAYLIIYALALGATARGAHYLDDWPGWQGWMLFVACMGAVMMAGAKILDALRYEAEAKTVAAAAGGSAGLPA